MDEAAEQPALGQRSRRADVAGLAVFLLACFAAAAIGGWVTAGAVDDWYPTLDKPSWTPPSWLFAPVWTVLYGMMAVAGWLVWRAASKDATRTAMALFATQLALNLLWSVLFFGLRQPWIAFAEILVLLTAIVATAAAFWPHRRAATWLMVPYIAWVAFASALNLAIAWAH